MEGLRHEIPFFLIAVLLGSIFSWPSSAHALARCAPHDDLLAELARIYEERLFAIGVTSPGALIEITVSPSGTFTIILTQPPGISCMVMGGEAWELVPVQKPGEKT